MQTTSQSTHTTPTFARRNETQGSVTNGVKLHYYDRLMHLVRACQPGITARILDY